MAITAASVLINFFRSESSDDRKEFSARLLVEALGEIEDTLEAWRRVGQPVSMYLNALPRWRSAVGLTISGDLEVSGMRSSVADGDLGLLETLALQMDNVTPSLDKGQRDDIQVLLSQILDGVKSDDSLPQELRFHIAELLIHVERCLTEYAIGGDFQLRSAVERLIAALHTASATSGTPATWTRIWDDYGKPVALGLVVEIPALIMGLNQLTTGS